MAIAHVVKSFLVVKYPFEPNFLRAEALPLVCNPVFVFITATFPHVF
jgi:hypothetical protein